MSAQGQNGGDGEQEESVMGRAREGRFEGIEESMDRLGQMLMGPFQLVSSLAGLSGLLPSRGTELLIELLLGQPLAGRVSYTGHGSLLVCDMKGYP
jgi:hypothetical protein